MPSYVIYGDNYLVSRALKDMEAQVGPSESLDANCHRLSGDQVRMADLKGMSAAVPFLADYRLIIVQGLLEGHEGPSGGRREAGAQGRRRNQVQQDRKDLGEWAGLAGYIGEEMPPTTLLVFAEPKLAHNNPLLTSIRGVCQVQEHPTPVGEGLSRWIRNAANDKGAQITPGAIRILSQLIGNNLWMLDNELEKLALYAGDSPIEESHVNLLVSEAKESSIFAGIDALLDGRPSNCLKIMHRLVADGAEFPYLVVMIGRQLRLVTLAKDLLDAGCPPQEIARRLRITHEFAQRRTMEQARRFPWPVLEQMYASLLRADLSVKTGDIPQEVALELIVGELSALVPKARGAPSRGRN